MTEHSDRWRIADGVTRDELVEYVTAMAEGVRLSGSDDEARAFDYAERFFRDLGFDIFRAAPELLVGYPVRSRLEVLQPESRVIECNGYSMSPSTSEDIEARLVDIGAGATGDYEGRDVTGCVVLSTGLATPRKALDVDASGAVAHIHVNDDHIHEMCISPVWGVPTPETADLLPRTPAIAVTAPDGEYLRGLLAQGDVTVRLSTETYLGWRPIPILTAELPGTEDDSFVMFSAHIDSWHYGAMDNASANAVQLAVARVLAEHRDTLRRGIRFAFWSGHSHGRFAGSAWYADELFDELRERCVLHVNVDSVGAVGGEILSDASSMAETTAFARELIREGSGQELEYRRIGRAADQSFWGLGIPSMWDTFSEQAAVAGSATAAAAEALSSGRKRAGGFGWWWHTTEDTLDKIDPDNLRRDARIYTAALWELCRCEVLPIDYAAGAREIRDRLVHYRDVGGDRLDLSALVERADGVAERLEKLQAAAPRDPSRAGRALREAARSLIPLNYTKVGPFDHDLALGSLPGVPALLRVEELASLEPGSPDYHSLRARLVREKNRVADALRTADRAVAQALEELSATAAT
jgi:hypothetical protein